MTEIADSRQAGAGDCVIEWVRHQLWEWENSEESVTSIAERLVASLRVKFIEQGLCDIQGHEADSDDFRSKSG